jgi:methionyl aminopeptidase
MRAETAEGALIELKSTREIEKMRLAGRVVAEAHASVAEIIRPGITTRELDVFIRDFVRRRKGVLLFFNYDGFPANSCISINEEVVHGIPSARRQLREGDIVSIDIGVGLDGYCGDAAVTYPVGEVSENARRLLDICRRALNRGIEAVKARNRVSHISRAIQSFVEGEGCSVVKKYVGHGIGRKMHEPPQIPNYVDRGFLKQDPVLKPGMVLAIEPMVNEGTEEVRTLADEWTVVTGDGKLSAHFEHTVAVTPNGPDILTLL